MTDPCQNIHLELLARHYVALGFDPVAALRATGQDVGRTDRAVRNLFERLVKHNPQFWVLVRRYTELVQAETVAKCTDVLDRLYLIATAPVWELTSVKHDAEGNPYVYVTPTEDLSEHARVVFDGAEQTKTGIKVKHLDRMKAMDMIVKIKQVMNITETTKAANMSDAELTAEVDKYLALLKC